MKFAALSLLVAVAAAEQVVLHPVQDATILAGQDHASESVRNQVGTTLEGARRALVQFDMSKIPQSATVSKVSLKVNAKAAKHNEVHVYRLASPWTESHASGKEPSEEDVTWKYSTYSTVPWRKEGADFVNTILASSTGSTFKSTANLKSTVQKIVHGDLPNFGFLLKGDELVVEPSYFEFSSMEGPKDALPQLIVDYDILAKKSTKKKIVLNQKLRGLQGGDGDGGGGVVSDGDGDGGDGDGGDGDGGDGDGGDGDGGDGDGGDGDGDGGDGDGGDGDGGDGDGDGGDGDGGDGDGDGGDGDGDGGDGDGGDGDGGDGDGDGGDGDGGDDGGGVASLCFSGNSIVELENVGPILMKDLKIGDAVKVASDHYERVYSFGHYNPESFGEFLNINNKLEVSAVHMLASETGFVPASSLKVGDSIITGSSSETVKSISTKTAKGMYAPFTPSGTILVNDVVASSFVTMQDGTANLEINGVSTGFSWHWIAHAFETPHRFICSNLDFDKWCANESYTKGGGISMWVYGPFHATKAVLNQNPVVASIMLVPAVVALALMWSIEQAASMGSLGATIIMATALLVSLRHKGKK